MLNRITMGSADGWLVGWLHHLLRQTASRYLVVVGLLIHGDTIVVVVKPILYFNLFTFGQSSSDVLKGDGGGWRVVANVNVGEDFKFNRADAVN